MAFDLSKFLARFVEETREHLHQIGDGFLALEQNPEDMETLNAIFRFAHTIKGSSRMMKLSPVTEVAHKLEDALDALRQKRIPFSRELSHLLFAGIDTISGLVERVAQGEDLSVLPVEEICQRLERAAQGDLTGGEAAACAGLPAGTGDGVPQASPQGAPPAAEPALPAEPARQEAPPPGRDPRPKAFETLRINAERLDRLIKLTGEISSLSERFKQRLSHLREVEGLARKQAELLSYLEEGNLSFYREELIHTAQSTQVELNRLILHLKNDIASQELLVDEIQADSLNMRMLPLSTVFDSLRRIVHDISRSLEKKIDLVIEGGETEIDKKIIEKIGDPLIHMVRNSIDHGIERPEDRVRAGKPETGTIQISACYEAGGVLIELSDDGAGIPLSRVRQKALSKKIFGEEELARMPESEILHLIFHPGFSTSEIITDVSGRGVGMDVVKRNLVEELKGAIQIETQEGRGTTFSIRLPLTLAMMHVLLVTVSGVPLAVPARSASEIRRISEDEVIEVVDRKAIRLREELIPLARLSEILGIPERGKKNGKGLLVLIARSGSEKVGFLVDSLLDEADMVIKPLPDPLKKIPWIAGVIVTGKNEIVNVLHVPRMVEAAKEVKSGKRTPSARGEEGRVVRILVVDDSINTREIEKSILEAYGYRVELAGDGVEALEKTRECQYDLVITDVEMPRMDGFSLTERLRGEERYRDTPIILLTSRDKEEDKRRGIRVGANAYIVKGTFDQSNLLETVQNLAG